MIDPDDPLQMVIVWDMWLTGTDIPCLHTLYIDKPMQGHNMIQAISRVNRVFRDKPSGLIVDYIGIGDGLREATARYTQGGGKVDPAPDLQATARPIFLQALDDLHATLPSDKPYGSWRRMSHIDIEDLYAFVNGYLAEDDVRRINSCKPKRGSRRPICSSSTSTNPKHAFNSRQVLIKKESLLRQSLVLAYQIQELLEKEKAKNLGQVGQWLRMTPGRISQIMNLLCLAPDIQEEILLSDERKVLQLTEHKIPKIPMEVNWTNQREKWSEI